MPVLDLLEHLGAFIRVRSSNQMRLALFLVTPQTIHLFRLPSGPKYGTSTSNAATCASTCKDAQMEGCLRGSMLGIAEFT